jgi:hypothetical protein
MGWKVMTFVNLLLYLSTEDLAYQGQYPLSIAEGSKGLLNNGAMDRAINVAVERGCVVEVVDELERQPN